jgi:hypothetical protein
MACAWLARKLFLGPAQPSLPLSGFHSSAPSPHNSVAYWLAEPKCFDGSQKSCTPVTRAALLSSATGIQIADATCTSCASERFVAVTMGSPLHDISSVGLNDDEPVSSSSSSPSESEACSCSPSFSLRDVCASTLITTASRVALGAVLTGRSRSTSLPPPPTYCNQR